MASRIKFKDDTRTVVLGVISSVVFGVATWVLDGVLSSRPALVVDAGLVGQALSILPTWISATTAFLAFYGAWTLTFGIYSVVRRTWFAEAKDDDPAGASLEVDLRSSCPIVLQGSGDTRRFTIWLRLTNHTTDDIRVTHLTAEAWFGQLIIKLTIDRPISSPALQSVRDVCLSTVLERTTIDGIEDFLASDNLGKYLAVYISVSGDSARGPIEQTSHFERRGPELTTIVL